PVDLVGQDNVGEERPRLENKLGGWLMKDAGADQVARQQVRRKLNTMKAASQAACQCLGEQRLADARNVLDEQMSVGQQRDEGGANDIRLAEDDAGQVRPQTFQQLRDARSGNRMASRLAVNVMRTRRSRHGTGRFHKPRYGEKTRMVRNRSTGRRIINRAAAVRQDG